MDLMMNLVKRVSCSEVDLTVLLMVHRLKLIETLGHHVISRFQTPHYEQYLLRKIEDYLFLVKGILFRHFESNMCFLMEQQSVELMKWIVD